MKGSRQRIHAVILAGGAGERFWPASRRHHPKPFLRVEGRRTLLDATLDRARRVAGRERVWVVCGSEHAAPLRRAAKLPAGRVLVEPVRRNTAMAVALAAQRIGAQDPDAPFVVLPADHRIPDARAFAADVRRAAKAAREEGVLVTLGVRPTRPDPGLGYIQIGRAVGRAHPGLHRARRFVEKPTPAVARRYLRQGDYLWNAGIFVWTPRTILEEIERCAPDLHRALAPLRRAFARSRRLSAAALRRAYKAAPSQPIDKAVMERSRRVWTCPVEWHWSDVGTWQSLAEELGVAPGASSVVAGDLAFDEPGGNLVWADGRTVALLGVEGLAVIETDDALLVARLDRSAELRRVVEGLKASGRVDVT
jgi:mannose-1-phosphate guanylyltransferase/mannose-6-phosphate isomerase